MCREYVNLSPQRMPLSYYYCHLGLVKVLEANQVTFSKKPSKFGLIAKRLQALKKLKVIVTVV